MDPPRETVIDLGLLDEPGPGTGARAPGQLRSWWGRRHRAVLPRLLTALVLVAVTGSVPHRSEEVATIALPPAGYGNFEVVGDLLFVAESGTEWVAYDLPSGERRWSLVRPSGVPLGLAAGDGVLFDRPYGIFGAIRKRATGEVLLSGDRIRLLSGVDTIRALPGAETALAESDYRLYADAAPHPRFGGMPPAGGRAGSRTPSPAGAAAWLAGRPPLLVSILPEGELELRDPGTGELLAGRRIRGPGSSSTRPAAVFPDTLVLQTAGMDRLFLRGYTLDGLTPRWDLVIPREAGRPRWVERCGSMLCIEREVAGGGGPVVDPMTGWLLAASTIEVVDPATGRVAWAATDGRTQLYPVRDRFLSYDARGALTSLLDARTGELLRDLTGWRAVVPAGAAATDVMLVRHSATDPTRVARLDLDTLALTDLGVLPGQPDPCASFNRGLVCRHGHQLWIWPW